MIGLLIQIRPFCCCCSVRNITQIILSNSVKWTVLHRIKIGVRLNKVISVAVGTANFFSRFDSMSTCISHPKLKSSFPSERMVVIKSNLHEELKATTTRQGYCKKLFREFFKLPRDGNIFCEDTKSNSLTICCGIFNCKCYFAQRPLVLPAGHFQKIFYMFRPLL